MRVFQAKDIPDSHKIKVYNDLCAYFTSVLDPYYTTPVPQDPRYDSGVEPSDATECVGLQVLEDGELGIVMSIEGWADTIGFVVDLPILRRNDQTDEGAWINVDERN